MKQAQCLARSETPSSANLLQKVKKTFTVSGRVDCAGQSVTSEEDEVLSFSPSHFSNLVDHSSYSFFAELQSHTLRVTYTVPLEQTCLPLRLQIWVSVCYPSVRSWVIN
jgi:hypothetical protein